MSADNTSRGTKESVSIAEYTGGHGIEMDMPGVVAQIEGPESYGDDVTVAVAAHDDGHLELTLEAEFEDAERLLNRDFLFVRMAAKDMPDGETAAGAE